MKNRKQFHQKLVNVFGEIYPSPFSASRKTVGVSGAIISIIKKHYSIKSFGTYESSVPKQLFLKHKDSRLAFLLAFLVDEGTLYDFVLFRLANKRAVKEVRNITVSLGYKCTRLSISKNKNCDVFGFSISNESIKKLSDDVRSLNKKYPTCNLSNKQDALNFLASLKRVSYVNSAGVTKSLILSRLKEKPSTVMGIARSVGVGRRAVRDHLGDLEKANKVRIKEVLSMGAKVWEVV